LPARVIAFDEREDRDLAVLEVKGVRQPPRPIAADQTAVESELFLTMPVTTLGFPLGQQIGQIANNRDANPSLTATPMSISGLRRDELKRLVRIQFSGGALIEGNSGGPVVDSKGKLVGVAVERLAGESVGFAVPPGTIAAFLAGDISGLRAESLGLQGGKVGVKFAVRMIDPLNRIKSVNLRYARAPSAAPATPTPPKPDAQGRFPLLESATIVPLTIAAGSAGAQFSVPVAKPEDRKLVVQFVLTDTAGRSVTSAPRPIELPEAAGPIAGVMESERKRVQAKWSCEVNLALGAKIANQPGLTTIDVPGGKAMGNVPQFKMYNAPSALVKASGDFLAGVIVANDFDPGGELINVPGSTSKKFPYTFQAAGLLIWQDEKNFVRFERSKGSADGVGLRHCILLEIYKGGKEAVHLYTGGDLPSQPYMLAAIRKGGSIQLLFGDQQKNLRVFKEMAIDFNNDVFVGVSAMNLSKRPFQARFQEFGLKGLDGRDIEAKPVKMTELIDSGIEKLDDGTIVLEGATLKVLKLMGISAESTDMSSFRGTWSGNRQLLWQAKTTGEALAVELPVETSGKYEIKGKFTIAPDYGKIKFAVDGKPLKEGKSTDFYNKETRPAVLMSLGSIPLSQGKHRFTFTVGGKNSDSSGYNFGVDELRLVPVK
jgi:hypothetical protein